MGTHPIFESDFDCLTEKKEMKTALGIVLICMTGAEFDEDMCGQRMCRLCKTLVTWKTHATRQNIHTTEDTYDMCKDMLSSCCNTYLLPFEGLTEVSADDQTSFQLQDVDYSKSFWDDMYEGIAELFEDDEGDNIFEGLADDIYITLDSIVTDISDVFDDYILDPVSNNVRHMWRYATSFFGAAEADGSSGMYGTIAMEPYSDNQNVTWTIGKEQNCTKVQIRIVNFDTEKLYDFLQIGDTRYSGQLQDLNTNIRYGDNAPNLRAPLFIGFTSDEYNSNFGGFKLDWKCTQKCDNSGCFWIEV